MSIIIQPGVSWVLREESLQRIGCAVTYVFDKFTPLSLCSDALAVTLPGPLPRSVRLSADPLPAHPRGVPHRFRECRSGTRVFTTNSGNSSNSAIACFCYVIPSNIASGLSGRGAILNGDLKDNCSATGQLAGVQTLEVGHALLGP